MKELLLAALAAFAAPAAAAAQGGSGGRPPGAFRDPPAIAPLTPGQTFEVTCLGITMLSSDRFEDGFTFGCDDGSTIPMVIKVPYASDRTDGLSHYEPSENASDDLRREKAAARSYDKTSDVFWLTSIGSVVQTFLLLKAVEPSSPAKLSVSGFVREWPSRPAPGFVADHVSISLL